MLPVFSFSKSLMTQNLGVELAVWTENIEILCREYRETRDYRETTYYKDTIERLDYRL
jgi:hypothetical protein